MSSAESNGVGPSIETLGTALSPDLALKVNTDADALWELVGGVHYAKVDNHNDQSAARLAARLAGVHPTASEQILHQLDRKVQLTRRRLALEKLAEDELSGDAIRIKARFFRDTERRDTVYERLIELETSRDALLPSFADAAAGGGFALSYDTLNQQRLEAVSERMRTPSKPWLETPVPGVSGGRVKIFKVAGPLCLGASVAISVGALYSVLNSNDFRSLGSQAVIVKLVILFIVGATFKLAGAVESQQQGRLRATAHQDPNPRRLWQEVIWRTVILGALWALLSVFEGVALESFAREVNRYNSTAHIQPLWVYILIGGILAGFGFRAAESVAFTDGLQELRDRFNTLSAELTPPSNPNLSRILKEGSLLLSLKERIAQERKLLESLDAQEQEPPQVSSRTQALLEATIAGEKAEGERLTELVDKYADVFTPLPHQVVPEEIVAPSPPKKIVKKKYYLLRWFRSRSSKGDD